MVEQEKDRVNLAAIMADADWIGDRLNLDLSK